jgi:ABC-type polysaccharide/polyol phosphate export permease
MGQSTTTPPDRMRSRDGGREVRVYEPHTMRIPPLGDYVAALWQRRHFMTRLARADLKAAHFNTVLGQFWTVLNPLMLAAVYWLLITIIRGGGLRAEPARLTLLIACIFLFYFTKNSLSTGARTVTGGGRLIMNTAFPRLLLPVTSTLEAFLQLLPSLAVYALIHVGAQRPVEPVLLLMPMLLLLHAMFNLGVASLAATATVYFRDTPNFLSYLLRLWMYATPVLYTVGDMPDAVRAFLAWNPLFPLFAAYQSVLMGVAPELSTLLAAGAWSAVFLVGGTLLFVSREAEFVVRL